MTTTSAHHATPAPLHDRTAIVTGAGRGIGAATARALAEAGAAVVVAARTEAAISAIARHLRNAGHDAWAVPCDVTDPDSIRTLAHEAESRLGHVDILINNAGAASSAPLHRITLDEWNRLLAVNATGTFLCTQAFVPGMAERGWGRVVNIASIAALHGGRYIAAYAAAKHAVLGFTRSVAAEVADRGVTVNAICPAYVDTEMTRTTIDNIVARTGRSESEALEAILAEARQRRLVTVDEVAHTVVSLCHDNALGTTGQAIVLDGHVQAAPR